jgi:Ca2+-transporting ATPase
MDLQGLIEAPTLTLLLIASAFLAKLTSVLLMVPLHRINLREGLIIGVSINAGLTTEIIVAQLMLDAQLIDVRLFTALVAASSVSTIGVPLVLTMLIRHWQDHISTQRED